MEVNRKTMYDLPNSVEEVLNNYDEIEKLREELSQKEKQIDILCDGMKVQREQIKALKDDLKELTRTILDVSDYAGIVLAEELKKKYKLGE